MTNLTGFPADCLDVHRGTQFDYGPVRLARRTYPEVSSMCTLPMMPSGLELSKAPEAWKVLDAPEVPETGGWGCARADQSDDEEEEAVGHVLHAHSTKFTARPSCACSTAPTHAPGPPHRASITHTRPSLPQRTERTLTSTRRGWSAQTIEGDVRGSRLQFEVCASQVLGSKSRI